MGGGGGVPVRVYLAVGAMSGDPDCIAKDDKTST